MAQGDTTVHVDFEVGGASAAKMTVMDVYRAQQANASKVNEAAKALAKEQNISFRDAKNAIKGLLSEQKKALNEELSAQKKADAQREAESAAREKARMALAAQKSRALEAQFMQAERNRKRAAEEAIRDAKRVAREEIRESKRVAREKERDLRMQEGQRGAMDKLLGRGIWGAAMGIAGYAGVAGVSNIISSVGQGVQAIIDKRAELEKAISPVVSLEGNVDRMGDIRKEVVSTSIAMGRSYEEVGRFYADLVGSTGNLASDQRTQLIDETKELANLTGGSLVTAQNLLTKSYQIYGKELKSVNELQNKLMATQDKGSIEFDEMALRLPEILQTGKFAGMSIDEVLGTVIGATRKSGSIEKTMTGMRNFFLIMEEAQKKGVTLSGTYTQQLSQLADLFATNAPKMQELFGKEVVVHAASVTDAWRDVRMEIEELKKVTGETDAVAEKMAKKYADPVYFAMRDIESIRSASESAPNLFPDVINESRLMKTHRRGLMGAEAVNQGTGGLFGGLGRVSGYIASLLGVGDLTKEGEAFTANERMGDTEFFKATLRKQFEDKKEADMQKIRMRQTLLFTPFAFFQRPFDIQGDIEEIQNRKMSPHLMPGKNAQSPEILGGGTIEDQKTHQLLEETNRILSQIAGGKSTQIAKPGGAKTNYEESV